MNGHATSAVTAKSHSTTLAFASVAAWLGAAAITRPLGIWPAIGGAAVLLGVAVLLFDHPASTALLQPSPRLVLLGLTAGGLMTDPEKTIGVKRIMGLIAKQLHECTAGSRFGKTNLQEFLQVSPTHVVR